MSLFVNGVEVTQAFYNGQELSTIRYNTTAVYDGTLSLTVEQKVLSVLLNGVTYTVEGYDDDKLKVHVVPLSGAQTSNGYVQVNGFGGMVGEASMTNDTSTNQDYFLIQGGGFPPSGLRIGAIDNGSPVLWSQQLNFDKDVGFTGGVVTSGQADGTRNYALEGSGFQFRFAVATSAETVWSDWMEVYQF